MSGSQLGGLVIQILCLGRVMGSTQQAHNLFLQVLYTLQNTVCL